MKLLDREPTPEMLSIISNEKEVFHSAESLYAALYDAAPETDAQAEIAKRDERIKELEERLAESVGGFKRDLVKQLQDCRKAKERQSAEISRLKAVIAKCHSGLVQCKQWKEGVNTLITHNHEAVEEALAAIKEIES